MNRLHRAMRHESANWVSAVWADMFLVTSWAAARLLATPLQSRYNQSQMRIQVMFQSISVTIVCTMAGQCSLAHQPCRLVLPS